jgi:alkanesulfonate monooxygenase SsuD/methylene tetrahydromethanopterin reductase-like flavin-dependent oxidoreductase (luciferase family)
MRFGLSLPQYGFSLAGGRPITHDALVSWGRRAESLGFDSVWVSDHFFYSFGRYRADPTPIASLEPVMALAALAAATERVRIGVLVLGAPFRHPALLAKSAATIDRIAGGRLELGLGAGWLEQEFDAFGYRFGDVGQRFRALEDALAIVQGLSAVDGPFTHVGATTSVHEARLTPAPTRRPIPTWVGGKGGPRLLRLAARYGAGWNVVWRFATPWYADRVAAARRACEDIGRDPSSLRLSVGFHMLLGEDEPAARAAFERGRAAMPGGAMNDDTYEGWRTETLSGTPADAIAKIHALEELGVEEVVVAPWVLPFAVPEPEQVDLFAERVLAPLR